MAGERRGPGRPRDETARRAIHEAALGLLERDGYGALTVEGIAREAGVGRQTIYRWWTSKADVVLEALNARAETIVTATDLAGFVRETYANGRAVAPVLAGLMAESQLDPAFGERFRADFLERRRDALRRAAARDLPAGADLDVVADLVFGPLWYLVLTRPAALSVEYAEDVLAAVRGQAGSWRT
jgi:AcrR family transcriptional regulator